MGSIAVMPFSAELDLSGVSTSLDETQVARLAQITHSERKKQFLAARYLAIELLREQGVQTELGAHDSGRPYAKHWVSAEGVSWTHNPHWVGAALGAGRVGIDIESVRPGRNVIAIAEQYFSPNEVRYLQSLVGQEQTTIFYLLWVAKEALLKALGTGIVGGLARFELFQQQNTWYFNCLERENWFLQVWQLDLHTYCSVASDTRQSWSFDCATALSVLEISC
ncbi:4'-phosphopantetheinyl transferase superfamily protein [Chitinibacter sp. SCUT-21]|uniref:4'-phosphopantetheinyl transferase family protein n=1 Tax=Chitinibacter sp. SCUT-21 TaxID=2970891 RepID=UPI0035A605CE